MIAPHFFFQKDFSVFFPFLVGKQVFSLSWESFFHRIRSDLEDIHEKKARESLGKARRTISAKK